MPKATGCELKGPTVTVAPWVTKIYQAMHTINVTAAASVLLRTGTPKI